MENKKQYDMLKKLKINESSDIQLKHYAEQQNIGLLEL